jgi:hypothetical protein
MNQDEFLINHLIDGKKYDEISLEHNISIETIRGWWETGESLRKLIRKSNQTFNNKKDVPEFAFFDRAGKRAFFEWYRKQPRVCGYCGIEEWKLAKLFAKGDGVLRTKRGRGQSLELERKDTGSNEYNESNCILACYVCNNHKSDLISEAEFREYFSQPIRNYLDSKFVKLTTND